MKKSFILAAIFLLICSFSASSQAATSSIDNLWGGAGIAYWQAGNGWVSLINIQSGDVCAQVYVGVYNSDGNKLIGFTMPLRPLDNVGISVEGDGTNIQLFDYSDTAYGGTPILNDASVGPPLVFFVPADADGIQRGYMTFVKTNVGCLGIGGAPSGNITGNSAYVSNHITVRSALLNPNNAFALNGFMLQGFANMATVRENMDFIDSTLIPNATRPCDLNNDGDTIDNFNVIDDINGADIDFPELLLTSNISPQPGIVCDSPGYKVYSAIGSSDKKYCGRYNVNPSVGSQSKLVIVAPQSAQASAAAFSRNLNVYAYNDEGGWVFQGGIPFHVVSGIPFGETGINIGSATAGEACFETFVPVVGFIFTETASFADLYPLYRGGVNIMTLNKDLLDNATDHITLP